MSRMYFDKPVTVAPLTEDEVEKNQYFSRLNIGGMKLTPKE